MLTYTLCSWLRPGVIHVAVTLKELGSPDHGAFFAGGHLYSFATLPSTMLARFVDARWGEFVTNASHDNAVSMLQRMLFMAYKWYEDPPTPSAYADGVMRQTSSRYDSLALCCLVYMCLCPDVFLPQGPRPAEDPAMKAQKNNAAILASEMVEKFRLAQGQDWECWLEINLEMEDLIAHNDDIPSVMRELVIKGEPLGGIHHPAAADLRRSFFSAPYSSPDPENDARNRSHWFNIGNGSALFNDETGVAYWPGNPNCQELNGRNGLLPITESREVSTARDQWDPKRRWMESVVPKIDNFIDEMARLHGGEWMTSPAGGSLLPGEESEYWIGLSVAGGVKNYYRDPKDWLD